MRAEGALFDWMPVDGHLGVVWLNGSVRVNCSRLKRHCLFVASVHALTNRNSPEVKEEFRQELYRPREVCVQQMLWSLLISKPKWVLSREAMSHQKRIFCPSRSDRRRKSSHPSLF